MKKGKKVINTKNKKRNRNNRKFLGSVATFVFKNYKYFLGVLLCLLLLVVGLSIIHNVKMNEKVITIDGESYSRSDFNIYLYSAKYNYFKDDINNISDDDLKVIYDKETNMTVGSYLKEVTLSDIKTASAIKRLASDNNIELTTDELNNLKAEKKLFIKKIGGKKVFNRLLKENNTTEKAYDKMTEVDALYRKVVEKLYSEGTVNDLTEEEVKAARESYKTNYFKIKQVILTTIDLNSGKNYNSTIVNQKMSLANKIYEEAKRGANFDELVKKYSEDSTDKEPPYDTYYKKGELLDELENALLNLQAGEVSSPVRTKYAFHIILKEKLDDEKFNEYLDELRENKCISVLKDLIDEEKIVYQEAYNKIIVE